MNESERYKLIFFHIPKCAGVSVRKAIEIDKSYILFHIKMFQQH